MGVRAESQGALLGFQPQERGEGALGKVGVVRHMGSVDAHFLGAPFHCRPADSLMAPVLQGGLSARGADSIGSPSSRAPTQGCGKVWKK